MRMRRTPWWAWPQRPPATRQGQPSALAGVSSRPPPPHCRLRHPPCPLLTTRIVTTPTTAPSSTAQSRKWISDFPAHCPTVPAFAFTHFYYVKRILLGGRRWHPKPFSPHLQRPEAVRFLVFIMKALCGQIKTWNKQRRLQTITNIW